ncbi:hypothetical protein BGX31_010435 [Mortierella sp. GBA43]|nr:hypothetical protein BGX31_010435 [Mortierella sp. GBA43]
MSKRKRDTPASMHPSNPYCNNPPDFAALAELYPSFKPFVTVKTLGSNTRGTIDFHDPAALRLCKKQALEDGSNRSIDFAVKNVARNNMQQAITIVKSSPSDIFPQAMFEEDGRIYDFCMCNPPFYKDEQDIQDSFESKEGEPSAVCQGTSNEMMTTGGEVQFLKQMIDESVQWKTRISMLGKKSSLDKVVAHLKEHRISNYTLSTLRQGQTTRWVIAWSLGDEHASWASMQYTSNKMLKMAAPTTVLSFEVADITMEEALERVMAILDGLSISHHLGTADPSREREEALVLQASARTNSWSRAARRALARQTNNIIGNAIVDAPVILGFDVRLLPSDEKQETSTCITTKPSPLCLALQLTWTFGQDRGQFESFFLHFRNRFLQPKSTASETLNQSNFQFA